MANDNLWLGLVRTKLSEVNKENKNLGGTMALREAITRARQTYVKNTKPTGSIPKLPK